MSLKPWETPTQDQMDAHAAEVRVNAPGPAPQVENLTPATDAPVLGKMDLDQLDSDLIAIMGSLKANNLQSLVVIGISPEGQAVVMRRAGSNNHPYAMIGALEAAKAAILSNEIHNSPVPIKGD